MRNVCFSPSTDAIAMGLWTRESILGAEKMSQTHFNTKISYEKGEKFQ